MDGARLVQSPALIQFEILMVPDIERRVVRKKPCCCIYTKMIMDLYIYIYISIYIYIYMNHTANRANMFIPPYRAAKSFANVVGSRIACIVWAVLYMRHC